MMVITLRPFILSALIILQMVPVLAQDESETPRGSTDDGLNCGVHISTYREYYKAKLYDYALESWWLLFHECPASSEKSYVDGVVMYRSFIEATPAGPAKEGLIDTMMLIYDQRIEYFGNEGNVLGRKGRDLLRYRTGDIEEVQKAYEMVKKSIEIQGKDSREPIMLSFISSGMMLNRAGKLDDQLLIEDYFLLTGILDQLAGKSSRWKKTRETIDDLVLKAGVLTCEALNNYFEPQFEQNINDKDFLENLIRFYDASACNRADLYVAASEQMYKIDPGPGSAHQLAILFIAKSDFNKAASYLKMAVIGEDIDNETRAEWFFELAIVSSANKEYCETINYAREAIAHRSNYGKAYLALGDAFIASRKSLGDEFQQRTAFWAAADMYQKAREVDPTLADEARQKLSDYATQYPHKEDVFFHDLKDGDPYQVGGCINVSTTVRSRQ